MKGAKPYVYLGGRMLDRGNSKGTGPEVRPSWACQRHSTRLGSKSYNGREGGWEGRGRS